ncbi:hypothetical protein chiPu_0025565 [Chiloscyllium punctatum]|uniref:Uncharacterized protein n=1 Tax=Chiloscyllium punctatum TaxID=137246 RepID=A0A401TH98_CHIPU|nr:hypothetical protein [Chiloscyllium punctatum]
MQWRGGTSTRERRSGTRLVETRTKAGGRDRSALRMAGMAHQSMTGRPIGGQRGGGGAAGSAAVPPFVRRPIHR